MRNQNLVLAIFNSFIQQIFVDYMSFTVLVTGLKNKPVVILGYLYK